MSAGAAAGAGGPPSLPAERQRFEMELEFVQGLANPHYLTCKHEHITTACSCWWLPLSEGEGREGGSLAPINRAQHLHL